MFTPSFYSTISEHKIIIVNNIIINNTIIIIIDGALLVNFVVEYFYMKQYKSI